MAIRATWATTLLLAFYALLPGPVIGGVKDCIQRALSADLNLREIKTPEIFLAAYGTDRNWNNVLKVARTYFRSKGMELVEYSNWHAFYVKPIEVQMKNGYSYAPRQISKSLTIFV
jgi:threonyl-tRNA synthetase